VIVPIYTISRTVLSKEHGILYESVIIMKEIIGVEMFTNKCTNVITILTDSCGNLITAFPGRL
jgi:hypothetical protein